MAKAKYGKWKPTGDTIGEGGQGQILLVESEDFQDKKFALKFLININRIDRIEKEINACLELNHKNIVNVVDYDLNNTRPYLVMNYYGNGSLDKFDFDNYDLMVKLELFKEICEGIAYAHLNEPPIIHRDIKPENIFLDDELHPIIGDFGLCFYDDDGDRFTLTEEAVGSRNYMSPELEDGIIDNVINLAII
ncbi:MAG: protein kinase [Methanobrevibacter sp.]|jgi:serine/threonine protein kinase|nr:protein kinase [Candidatus Methanoflexus mossambicus]